MLDHQPVPDGIVPLVGYREWSIRNGAERPASPAALAVPSYDAAVQ